MAYASIAGRAVTDPDNPRAHAICDRCGFRYNLRDLAWQYDWAGASLINKRILVCSPCRDTPQEQLRAIIIPADPMPVRNPRVEPFAYDETDNRVTQDGDYRITIAGDYRVTQETGEVITIDTPETYDQFTLDLVENLPTAISSTRLAAINDLFVELRAAGVIDRFDYIFDLYGAEDTENRAKNLVNPTGSFELIEGGTSLFATGYGTKFNGTDSYLNPQFIPGEDGTNFQTTLGSVGVYVLSNIVSSVDPAMSVIGTNGGRIAVLPRISSNLYSVPLNTNTSTGTSGGTVTTSKGLTAVTRNGLAVTTYKEGAQAGWAYTMNAVAVLGQSIYFGARNNNGTADQFSSSLQAIQWAGDDFSDGEMQAIATAFSNYIVNMQAADVFVSSATDNDIPVGSDSGGIGSDSAPYLTFATAVANVASRQTIKLNGVSASPTAYSGATQTVGDFDVDSVVDGLGGSIQSTSTTIQVLTVAPGAGGVANFGKVIIDGQNVNPQSVEISNAVVDPFTINMTGTKIQGARSVGIWTSQATSYVNLNMNDVDVVLDNTGTTSGLRVRGAMQVQIGAGGSINVNNGNYDILITDGSYGAFCYIYGDAPGIQAQFNGSNINVVSNSTYFGASCTTVRLVNVVARINNLTMFVDTSLVVNSSVGIALRPSQDASVQDMGGFSISGVNLTMRINAAGSGGGIWIGYDGIVVGSPANGMLNGGSVTGCSVQGYDSDTQASGFHGIVISNYSDALVQMCSVKTAFLGIGVEEASPRINYCTVTDCTSSYFIYKANRPGMITTNSRSVATAGNSGTHVRATPNPDTGNNCVGGRHEGNIHIIDGATNCKFVQVEPDQELHLARNVYYLRSGSMHATPWQYGDKFYSTFEEWQREVEPTALWYDPDA